MLLDDYPDLFNDGSPVVVAATGMGLTDAVAHRLTSRAVNCIAVNDAVFKLSRAQILYAADSAWWRHHRGAMKFEGERWSVLDVEEPYRSNKLQVAREYDIILLDGKEQKGFSHDRRILSLGRNSGFQAVNLAMHLGAKRIVLVGFNMSGPHYFGPHPLPLRNSLAESFISNFEAAVGSHPGIEILNATPGSKLKCYPTVELEDVIK